MYRKTCAATEAGAARARQAGFSAILIVLLGSMLAAGTVYVMRAKSENSLSVAQEAARSSSVQQASATAAELIGQLAGNKIVTISGGKFRQASGTAALVTAGRLYSDASVLRPAGNSSWYLNKSTGRLFITNCTRPQASISGNVFAENDDASWVRASSGCDAAHRATTEAWPVAFHAADINERVSTRGNITNANASAYTAGQSFSANNYEIVRVAMRTTLPGRVKRQALDYARIALPEVTRVCATEEAGCRTDHCPFMEPGRLRDGSIWYKADGTPYLRPNEKYSEALHLRIDFSAHRVNLDPHSGSSPTNLINWYQSIFAAGRRNPFVGDLWQGTGGYFEAPTYYIRFLPGTSIAELHVPMESGPKGPGNVKFDGYLYKTVPPGDGSFNSSGSSTWGTWPYYQNRPYVYEEVANMLKWGCMRTVGDMSPDFCTKISVTYAKQQYDYPMRRQCTYRIPKGVRLPWSLSDFRTKEVHENLDVDDKGTVVKTSPEPYEVVDDRRQVWVDNRPHVPFDYPANQSLTPVAFSFPDLKIGKRIVTRHELKKKKDLGGGDWEYTYEKSIREETYEVRCEEKTWNDSSATSSKDMTACIYIKNYGIYNRSSCDQQQIPVICRNGDGCFAGDTRITMADGSEKLVKQIVPGDLVRNPLSLAPLKVAAVSVGDEELPLRRILAGGKEVRVTRDHPMLARTGVRRAEDVVTGDEIMVGDGSWQRVEAAEDAPSLDGPLVYNLTLERDAGLGGASHLLIANGVVSGDLQAQTSQAVREAIEEATTRR